MIEVERLRREGDLLEKIWEKRGFIWDRQAFERLDRRFRSEKVAYEALLAKRNQLAQRGAGAPDETTSASRVEEGRALKEQIEAMKASIEQLQAAWMDHLLHLPNLPDPGVPEGEGEQDNLEVHRKGAPPAMKFPIKAHFELGREGEAIDFSMASEVSGSRFAYLHGGLAELHRALGNFMCDLHVEKHHYQEVNVPCLVRASSLQGTGQLPKFEEDLFRIAGFSQAQEPLYLIPTAEVPLTNLVRGKVVAPESLPLKWVSRSLCFRSEAGAYGRDTRGIIRQHQFEKVELVQAVLPEHSDAALESMVRDAEAVLEALELPYRRILLCTKDMGFSAQKTYDLEVWMPGQSAYREISSCSNCGDFQARRLKAYYSVPAVGGQAKPQRRFLHLLNGSGVAVGRCLAAVMENYQTEEGNIRIPEVLKPYLRGRALLWEA